MAVYKFNSNQVVKRKKFGGKWLPLLLAVVIACGLLIAGYYYIKRQPPAQPVSGAPKDLGSFNPNKTFETEWFSFEAPKSWAEVPELSSPTTFVYREFIGATPTGLLTIYVNTKLPPDSWFTNVVPVRLQGSSLIASDISPHCKESVPDKKNRSPQSVKLSEVSFTCFTDSNNLMAAAGEIGGSTSIVLPRKDGSKATYSITYQNLAFSSDGSAFARMLSSFRAK